MRPSGSKNTTLQKLKFLSKSVFLSVVISAPVILDAVFVDVDIVVFVVDVVSVVVDVNSIVVAVVVLELMMYF